jgi:hypothetical protein
MRTDARKAELLRRAENATEEAPWARLVRELIGRGEQFREFGPAEPLPRPAGQSAITEARAEEA